jgi:hypothetical protein
MQTSAILENAEGFRWDLFVNKVCNAISLSTPMKQRSKQLYKSGHLTVLITSKEDIDDMRILAESGLNWDLINQECQNQSAASGVTWEDALYQNLLDLKTKHNIESPIEKQLRTTAEKKIIETTMLKQIEKGNNTSKRIAQEIKEPQSFVRTELNRLANKGLITVDKSHKPHKFYLNKTIKQNPD